MASSTQGTSSDTTPVDLRQNVNGDGTGSVWHRSMSPNSWAWTYVVLAAGLLWLLGYVFR